MSMMTQCKQEASGGMADRGPPALRGGGPSRGSRHHAAAEATHPGLHALSAEKAEAQLAQNMAGARVAQLGNLLGNIARRADQRPRAQSEADAVLLRVAGIRPRVQHGWVGTEG